MAIFEYEFRSGSVAALRLTVMVSGGEHIPSFNRATSSAAVNQKPERLGVRSRDHPEQTGGLTSCRQGAHRVPNCVGSIERTSERSVICVDIPTA
jgi:hypothetical protein